MGSSSRGLNFILQSTNEDRANTMARYIRPRSGWIGIETITLGAAVYDVINRCRRERKLIQAIYIIAHGSPEGQEFGERSKDMLMPAAIERVPADNQMQALLAKRPPRPHQRKELPHEYLSGPQLIQHLIPYFNSDGTAELILGGCRVGVGDTARTMSCLLPNILVSAFDMAQLPTGMDSGTQTFFRNGVCVKVSFHANLSTVLSITETVSQSL